MWHLLNRYVNSSLGKDGTEEQECAETDFEQEMAEDTKVLK